MNPLREAAQQALDSINELFTAEQSEGGERSGHIRTPATREHLVRIAQARKALHESCGALRAALTQQAEPDHETRAELAEQQVVQLAEERDHYRNLWQKAQQAEPVEPVAWVASKDGRVIYDDSSTDDSLLRVSGDFEGDEQRSRYAQRIVDKLNAAPPQRTMVPLTEEEIDAEWRELDGEVSTMFMRVLRKFARAVEKTSWKKNHGQA